MRISLNEEFNIFLKGKQKNQKKKINIFFLSIKFI
jgi:hypothetical protein